MAGQKPTAPETPKTVPSSRKIIFSGDLETINERIHNTTAAATRVRRLESLRFFFIPNDNSQSRRKISRIYPHHFYDTFTGRTAKLPHVASGGNTSIANTFEFFAKTCSFSTLSCTTNPRTSNGFICFKVM